MLVDSNMPFTNGSCYSGSSVDYVSLALSGGLFSWSKPLLGSN